MHIDLIGVSRSTAFLATIMLNECSHNFLHNIQVGIGIPK